MRGIKTPKEVLKIKKACALGDKIYFQIQKVIKIGITERDLSLEIQRLTQKHGASLSFRPIVAFGKNAYEIHHKPTNLKLNKSHGFVMIDLGVKLNNYCSDMTRTLFVGRATAKQKRIYKTVLESQRKAIVYLKLSRRAIDIDKAARDYINTKGYPQFRHSLGHGIGKKVHESFRIGPKSKTILKSGMVFTIEPGIYIKNYGGVRIEDTFYLNNDKLFQLTKSPKELLELI